MPPQTRQVRFEVLEEVKIGDKIVIPKGSLHGEPSPMLKLERRMGRAGKLDVNIDNVRRVLMGKRLRSRGLKDAAAAAMSERLTVGIVATSSVLWPAAPLLLLIHGKDITIPKGTEITAYINGNTTLNGAKFASR